MSIRLLNLEEQKIFFLALNDFQKADYRQALERFQLIANENKSHSSELISGYIGLCKHYLGGDSYSLFINREAAKVKLLEAINCELVPEHVPSKKILYTGELLNKEGKLNAINLVEYFLQSPWQLSLVFTASLLANELDILKQIEQSAKDACQRKTIKMSSLLYIFLSPLGLPCLNLAVSSNTQATRELSAIFSCLNPYEFFKNTYFISLAELRSRVLVLTAEAGTHFNLHSTTAKTPSFKTSGINSITAGTIFLNEQLYILRNLFCHYNLVNKWILVEGACKGYPGRKVTAEGFSLDNSSLNVLLFPDKYCKLQYVQHGWTKSDGEDAKSEIRNEYLKRCFTRYLVVIDADEFYLESSFQSALQKLTDGHRGVIVPQIHCWKNQSSFIIGGYYDITHMRFFAISQGMKYVSNHNFPEDPAGVRIDSINNYKFERRLNAQLGIGRWEGVYCIHLGFAKSSDDMRDKTDYYINRGEKVTRPTTTLSRQAWFDDRLPPGCLVYHLDAEMPEVLGS